ncbi:hypothetical protein RND81_06G174700 [Saponaria officinalis]|uniref:Pentatricopeptide repeat-containing protein n=3 Tax=Saponaria officinalis TaxID=3572 RepID=A0AAW1KCQ0_SAPOF
MGSLHLPVSLDSYEPLKFNFNLGYVQLHNTQFLNCSKVSGFSLIYTVGKIKHVQASRFDSELVDSSEKSGDVEGVFGIGPLGRGLVDENSSSSHGRGVGSKNVWRRYRGARDGEEKSKHSCVYDELDVGVYGVGSNSSIECCNKILRGFEEIDDDKALKFFEWMRCNGKVVRNVMGYNLILRVLGRRGDWEGAKNLIGEMIFQSECELEVRVFNTIIYACSKKGLVDVGAKWFRMMLEFNVEPNIATFGMLMGLYKKGWNVEESEFAFAQMRKLNIVCQSAYSAMITIYTRLGLHAKAEEVIHLLVEDKVALNLENYLVMLNAYSQQGKLKEAENVLASMHEAGFPPNIIAYNTLITGYGKSSNMVAAEQTFQNLQHLGLDPDETSYRSMIEGWARFGSCEKAKWYYERLKDTGFTPNSSNLYSLINLQAKHRDEDGAVRTLDDMLKMGCQPASILGSLIHAYDKAERFDVLPLILRGPLYEHVLANQTACSILAMAYVKHSLVEYAIKLLRNKKWKDLAFEDNLYHLLICSCKELGHLENAVEIFTHMPKSVKKPNLHILSTMIDIYCIMDRFSEADRIYQLVKSSGLAMDMVAFSIVVRMYVRAGLLEDACRVLDAMDTQGNIVPDIYLLRDMFRVYQRCNKRDKLSDLYYKILKRGVIWDQEMYNCVINCCAHALPVDELSKLFDEMIQKGFSPNTITYNVMLDVYGKSRLFNKARKVFLMAKKQGLCDVISYNTLVAAYGRNKDFKNMTRTVELMQFDGFAVSLEAYNSMLDAYGKEHQMEDFRSVLLRLKKSSGTSDHYTYNILINIYGEQGWIDEVACVLKELKDNGPGPDLCSYNTLIKAYGIAGMVEDAVSVIKEMREKGIEPDRITYLNLITALRRNDMFLEAVRWSLWMKQTGFS